MKRCLVLGGNGFLGSHLAEALVVSGFEVTIFDNREQKRPDIREDSIGYRQGDFLNENDLARALDGTDYVFHFISMTLPGPSLESPVYDIESNVIGTVRLLQQCCKAGVEKIIFPSSGGTVYGEPDTIPVRETDPVRPVHPYAISKVTIEMYLRSFYELHGLDYLILRYANPYGERQMPFGNQGVIPIFLHAIMKGRSPVIYGDGSMVRDYIYISDLVDATIAIVKKDPPERLFNVGSGRGTSVHELLGTMAEVLGVEINPLYADPPGTYLSRIILDISRMQHYTGWKPRVGLAEGIERTYRWLKSLP